MQYGPAGVLTRSAYYITQDLSLHASVHLCRGGFEKSSPFLERTQNGRGLSQLHYSHCLYDCNFLWGHNTLYHPPAVPRPLWSSLHGLKPATGRNSMATWMPLIGLLNFHCNVYPGKIECHPWQWFGKHRCQEQSPCTHLEREKRQPKPCVLTICVYDSFSFCWIILITKDGWKTARSVGVHGVYRILSGVTWG